MKHINTDMKEFYKYHEIDLKNDIKLLQNDMKHVNNDIKQLY